MGTTKIKICGVKTFEIAEAVIENGGEFIGFIFFEKSPRNISIENYGEIAGAINGRIKRVAVVVDASDEILQQIYDASKPDYFQLHGSEFPERVLEIKQKFEIPIIKAISVSSEEDLKKVEEYKRIVDFILFDAKPPKNSQLPGGNAVSFDWNILKDFKPDYKYILSGGLNSGNIRQALEITGAEYIDISSGVEKQKGVKDLGLVEEFLEGI